MIEPAPPAEPVVVDESPPREEHRQRRLHLVFVAASSVVFLVWAVSMIALRMKGAWAEFAADGDQPQAIFYYWKYHLDGVFPGDNPLTEFASVMHTPPLWWLLLATLSLALEPLFAAKLLNVVALIVTPLMAYLAVKQRSNHFIGLAAAALLLRSADFSTIIAGGYARSFGPFLVYLFLWAYIGMRHRACLTILVLQAAFYPSVVIPCGLAYGVTVLLWGPTRRERIRRCAGMFVAGLLVIGFGKYQDIKRPEWWGSLVWKAEAAASPAWFRPDGRFHDLPLRPLGDDLRRQALRGFRATGDVLFNDSIVRFDRQNHHALILVPAFLCIAVLAIQAWRRRRARGELLPERERFPWQIPALALAAFVSILLTRGLAFKLYVPHRVLAHTWPYLAYAALPLLAWHASRRLWSQRGRATVIALLVALVPTFGLSGDGTENRPRTYVDYGADRAVWRAIRELPVDAVIAGATYHTDRIPLFGIRQVYANRTLCQPWRMGYYAECERRLVETYRALYATTIEDVVAFAEREQVDYLVYSPGRLQKLDRRLFEPVRSMLKPTHAVAKKRGFALANPPEEAIVLKARGTVIVDVAALRDSLARPSERPAPVEVHEGVGVEAESPVE